MAFKKLNINWSARQLIKMCINKSITFENTIQRGYVWDIKRKSLLIESMIIGYPIPAFYAVRGENKVFDMLDGKQRSQAIVSYCNNEFPLTGVSEEYEGKYFEELSEDTQDEIKSYSLTIYYFEDITDEEINEMFYRLNNGKALTAIELTRVKAKSFDKIKELASHEIFKSALKESQINRYTNEDIVIKSLIMLNCERPSLKNDFIRPYIVEAEITDDQAACVRDALTQLMNVHDILVDSGFTKPARKLYMRTHLISLVPYALESYKAGEGAEVLSEFVKWFFNPDGKGVTRSTTYNAHSSSGSNSEYSVAYRDNELKKYYKEFMENGEKA